ncbi:MAG: hypothetical protein ACP5PZ_02040 [Bacteroidales bacterium]
MLTFFLLGVYGLSFGQNHQLCKIKDMGEYTIDGQSYILTFEEKPQVSMYMVFFSGFDYRLHFCSKQIKAFQIRIYDIEKKLLISEFCKNHEMSLDFRFESNLAAIVEISQQVENETQMTLGEIWLTVGFKENKVLQFK